MPTYLQLMMSNPSGFSTAGATLRGVSTEFNSVAQMIRTGMATATAVWTGKTMHRAREVTRRFSDGVAEMGRHTASAGQGASTAGPSLQAMVTQLRTASQTAQGAGFLVFPVGQVFPGPSHYSQAAAAGPGAPAVIEAYLLIARAWTMYLTVLVQLATVEDQLYARQIQVAGMMLNGTLPFRSSLRAPAWFTPGGPSANNIRRGQLGEELNGIWADMNGHTPVGTQMPFRPAGGGGASNLDRITLGPDGRFYLWEAKAGGGHFQPNQLDVLPRIPQGGAVPDFPGVGGLPRGGPMQPGQVNVGIQRWDVDNLPRSVRDEVYNGHSLRDVLGGGRGPGARQDLLDFLNNPANRRTDYL
jgi:hypothetical protein